MLNNNSDLISANTVPLELMAINSEPIINDSASEIVFIDSTVAQTQVLIDQISGATEVVVLDPQLDGVAQIEASLSQYQAIDAVHLKYSLKHQHFVRIYLHLTKVVKLFR